VGPGPILAGFTPSSGAVGDVISIVGSGLDEVSSVRFGSADAAYFTVNAPNQITATVPLGARSGRIEVSGTGGSGIAATDFTVTQFSPVFGPVGTSVLITGAGFTGTTAVTFQGAASLFTVDSDAQVTAIVPDGATTGRITIHKPGGNFVSETDFTVTAFSPVLGPVGTTVVVRDSGFSGATAVTFNGAGAGFTVDSDAQVRATVPAGATTGPIAVTSPGGTFTSPTDFTVTPFDPVSGAAGASVVIAGANFLGATEVEFNGAAAAFTVDSDIRITAVVPANATTGPISIAAPAGGSTTSSHFGVTSAAIVGFDPPGGVPGTSVVIEGANLRGASSVEFNGMAALYTVDAPMQITAVVPSAATSGPIKIVTPAGTAVSSVDFDVTLPVITSFDPTGGAVGASVVITGANLTGASSVKFNGTSASFTVDSATQITATVPAGAATGFISVTAPGGTATSATNFTVVGSPAITSFTPTSGPVGASVVITGTNLTGATSVKFNGTSASFTVDSATQITAAVLTGATTGPISVTTPGGTATSATNFTVVGSPTIASFTPASGPVGTSVVITGTNLTGASSVKFNGTSASFTVDSATQITAAVPAGATTGPISVTTPGGTATSATSFTVAGSPTISGFTPTSGAVGASVVITGTNLTGASSVKFNGTSASFTVNSSSQITATVPAGTTTGPVSVTTPGGTATSAGNFTVAPKISNFSPTSGPVGTSVVITGTTLTGATSVKFSGTTATFTVNSSTQITATVPGGAVTGPISVTTPGGTTTSATNFLVTPKITNFNPKNGPVGTSVVITGAGLTGATSVKFNGTTATYTVNSSTQVTATVPAGATTGKISLTTAGGTATSASNFKVTR
jgi:hypothetical protein